jgi:endonuclease III
MQPLLFPEQRAELRMIRDRLAAKFGRICDDERAHPTSQFVWAFLRTRTYGEVAAAAFWRLRARYPSWDEVADAPVEGIAAALADSNFLEKKAPELKQALRQIRARAGLLDLEFLADLSVEAGLLWLEQLHGAGRKIAAATLNFSTLRQRAFVIDTHVLRVLRRFGFVAPHADEVRAYDAVMACAEDLDADDLYELHWYLKGLGQAVCTHFRALCLACPLSELCLKRIETPAVAVTSLSGDAA